MQPRLAHLYGQVTAWLAAHPPDGGLIVAAVLVTATLAMLAMAWATTHLVTRRVFGNSTLPTIQQSIAQAQQSQADTTRMIQQMQAETTQQMQNTLAQMQADVERMAEITATDGLPLTVVVSTPEERQTMEALITRGNTRVVYRSTTTRVTKTTKLREELPTSWERILGDDEEDGSPCPKKPTTEQPKAESPKAQKRLPKPKLPKPRKG